MDVFYEKLTKLKYGSLSCVQNAQDFLAEIEKNDEKYNIFLELDKNIVEKAKELDKKRDSGANLGKLFGVIVAIKSNISYVDKTISCASKTLNNYKGTYNADVIEKLLKEDALIIGILNNDEFASGSSGETSAFGNTINPTATNRVPGGSSSASAASVAANFCDIALGTDTGGSIRNPASHCGVVGVKPSYGRVSRYGLLDLSMSLDQIGPFSHSVYASALVMEIISGFSNKDSTTKDIVVGEYSNTLDENRKLKIGVIKSFDSLIVDNQIKETFETAKESLAASGHEIIELDLKCVDLGIQAYYPIVYTEFFSGTRKYDSVKYGHKIEESGGEEVLRRILGGKEISKSEFDGAYYKKALKVKEIISEEFEKAFSQVDVILSPTTPMLPHKFDETLTTEQMYAYDAFTIPANLAGICAGVVRYTPSTPPLNGHH